MKTIGSLALVLLLSTSSIAYAENPMTKEETVYVNLSTNGEVKDIIVSDWIHSNASNIKVKDQSILTGIKNVKGEEVPQVEGNHIIWELEGQDLFYQGNTDKEIPMAITVNYFLNNAPIEPSEIGGKTGKVKIELQMINKEKHSVVIDGEARDIYTPFAVASIINLPRSIFSNVTINTGKIINDGNNQIITYMTVPGLNEMMGDDDLTAHIPDKLIVEADAKEFEIGPIMMTATSQLPEMKELDNMDSLSELIDSIGQLESASSKLNDGTATLSKGQTELVTNLEKFKVGVDTLGNGSTALIEGVSKLKIGIDGAYEGANKVTNGIKLFISSSEKFGEGVHTFSLGAQSYAAKAGEFAIGASKLTTGLGGLTESTHTLEVGAHTLTEGTTKLINGGQEINVGISGTLEAIKALIEVEKQRSPNSPMLPQLIQIKEGLNTIQQGSKNITTELENLKEGQEELALGLEKLSEGTEGINEAANLLQTGSEGLGDGANQLAESAVLLGEGASGIVKGSDELVTGSQAVSDGLGQLSGGSQALLAGKDQLEKGNEDLLSAVNLLVDGGNKLKDGSKELQVNMNKFHQEGVKELSTGLKEKNRSIG